MVSRCFSGHLETKQPQLQQGWLGACLHAPLKVRLEHWVTSDITYKKILQRFKGCGLKAWEDLGGLSEISRFSAQQDGKLETLGPQGLLPDTESSKS